MPRFTVDWFSGYIPAWNNVFSTVGKPKNVLEIGSFEGRSACFILENTDAKITCVDTWLGSDEHTDSEKENLYERFYNNVKEYGDRVIIERGESGVVLRKFPCEPTYDFIYIDGSHYAKDVLEDAVLSWRLLKDGGVIIFDDLRWTDGSTKDFTNLKFPFSGINAFVAIYKPKILAEYNQLVIQKFVNTRMLSRRFNVYSQFGEDGIIEYLFEKLEIKDGGTCCEFGAWDGKHLSNTFRLVKERQFKALYIEGDEEKYKELLKTAKEYPTIVPHCEMIDNNLDSIFENLNFPFDIDLLSIDVDSIDYEIWDTTKKVNPKIVIIEPNGSIPSWEKIPYSREKGASYYSLETLGNEKGYTLVCNTGNLVFVRNDVMNDAIEIDDRLFPWHLEPNLKYAILNGLHVPFDVSRYREGARLGYIGPI